jgi:hypothetical protein
VRTLFEKLIITQLVKKYPAFFMEPEGSLLCSQKLATGPYPEPAESSSPHRSLLPKVTSNKYMTQRLHIACSEVLPASALPEHWDYLLYLHRISQFEDSSQQQQKPASVPYPDPVQPLYHSRLIHMVELHTILAKLFGSVFETSAS